MNESPILFNGSMVRAILAGKKTQTRRIVRPESIKPARGVDTLRDIIGQRIRWEPHADYWHAYAWRSNVNVGTVRCPYRAPGWNLWVRETWRPTENASHIAGYEYQADDSFHAIKNAKQSSDRWLQCRRPEEQWPCRMPAKWRPSIHMPRWASRILLEVESIRIERLQAISGNDARAEGLSCLTKDGGETYKWGIPDRDGLPGTDNDGWPWHEWNQSPVKAFSRLWDSINTKLGTRWKDSPWVWVVTFKRRPSQ